MATAGQHRRRPFPPLWAAPPGASLSCPKRSGDGEDRLVVRPLRSPRSNDESMGGGRGWLQKECFHGSAVILQRLEGFKENLTEGTFVIGFDG